jgi:hypothetical protein
MTGHDRCDDSWILYQWLRSLSLGLNFKYSLPIIPGHPAGAQITKPMPEVTMKKLKHEAELFKGALLAGVKYAEGRGVVEFEPTDSASEKLLYIYRLLVHDKVIQPLPEDQVAEKTLRHKLAIWYSKQLPKDHPLLQ